MTTVPVTTWLPASGATTGDLLESSPAAYQELCALYDGLWDAGLDAVTLELCRLRLAALIGSRADLATIDPRAVAAGLDDETVAALGDWPSSPRFTAAQRVALAFSEQYVMDPHGFTDGDGVAAAVHFSPAQLTTLTIAVAVFDALARVRSLLTVADGDSELPLRAANIGVGLGLGPD